jgi:hypothetical protein
MNFKFMIAIYVVGCVALMWCGVKASFSYETANKRMATFMVVFVGQMLMIAAFMSASLEAYEMEQRFHVCAMCENAKEASHAR